MTTAPASARSIAGFRILPFRAPRLRRAVQLIAGLVVFGVALGMAIEASLGTNPWTVLAEGLAERTGLTVGSLVVLIGLSILAALWALGEPLGLGTVCNVAIIGPVVDAFLWIMPDVGAMPARLALIAAAPIVLGFGSGLYLGAGVGPGPRDGLMTALHRRGLAIWRARTVLELSALGVGWLLGGEVGFGTVWMAVAIGPSIQFFLPMLTIDSRMTQQSTT